MTPQQITVFANIGLQVVTIIVLVFTCVAAFMQAKAAKELTDATNQQIKTGAEQAAAARDQVNVAKRQITESLRPILTCKVIASAPTSNVNLIVKNEGAGVALDVWWMYGKPGDQTSQRNRIAEGIVAPGAERALTVSDSRAFHEGVLIVYESLAGITSGTQISWTGKDYQNTYHPEIDDWARSLLGKVLGSMPSS